MAGDWYYPDVDAIYEDRFMLSDLDDAPWGDEDEWLTPPLGMSDNTCVVCEREFEKGDLLPCPDYPDEMLCRPCYADYTKVTQTTGEW